MSQAARRRGPIPEWCRDGAGQGLVEYALIIGGVVLAVFAAVLLLGQQVDGLFNQVVACFQNLPHC